MLLFAHFFFITHYLIIKEIYWYLNGWSIMFKAASLDFIFQSVMQKFMINI
jgi:hypothetical protein